MTKRNSLKSRTSVWRRRRWPRWLRNRWSVGLSLGFFVVAGLYVVYLDYQIRAQFEGKRWAIPAKVYARPLELYPEMQLNAEQFEYELKVLAYRRVAEPKMPGSYYRMGNQFYVITRAFTFWDGSEPSLPIRLDFADNHLVGLSHAQQGVALPLVRLDPGIIGRIYPQHNEDRILVKLDEVPPLLIKALLTVEDRDFYSHYGVSPRSILRAMWANLRAGATVQGGSTLTQQLVKNFFLSNERTLWRKLVEATMALLLDWHYAKDDILQAYLNEIYLGQDGRRAIHGFGLASYFYFEQPLRKLNADQIALLVAMVKGPSYYNPRRYPDRAKERRDLVLDLLVEQHDLTAQQAGEDKLAALDVTPIAKSNVTSYPAFMDLVRRQLKSDYKEKDLSSEGLSIFTTLDPQIQYESEKAVERQLKVLGQKRDTPDSSLQTAAIVVSVDGAEVLAVVGDRNPQFAGFNRAIDAIRPIGSLVKPAVYLTALNLPERFTLATILDDGPISLDMPNGTTWQPLNYDKVFHGMVPLRIALANSYNLATARIGLDVGAEAVVDTMHRLGVERDIKPYPSLFLGAAALTPLEVMQMYHTLASAGFRSPLRAIREVLNNQGQPLQRYPWSVEKVAEPGPLYLLNNAMRYAVKNGTGQAVYKFLPPSINVAGKTGTSDDLRDSWFAGYTEDKLGVVWIGKDNNDSTGLTGASGALRVWAEIFAAINPRSGEISRPDNVEMVLIDPQSGLLASNDCEDATEIPFIKGSAPTALAPCAGGSAEPSGWIKGLF